MSARSALGRLEALEVRAAQRRGATEAAKEKQTAAVLAALAPAERDALEEMYTAAEDAPAWWEEVSQAAHKVSSNPLPGGEAARSWADTVRDEADGTPWPRPPSGAAAYL